MGEQFKFRFGIFERGFKRIMIIEKYDESLFIQRFENYKRVITPENPNGNFTYSGLRALFEYLDELGTEENPIKLDVIGLCCDFSEYGNVEEYLIDYGNDDLKRGEDETEEEHLNRIEEHINENSTLIKIGESLNEGFIIRQY